MPRSRLRLFDQFAQAFASLLERPGRTVLSTSLVAVGAALIVIVTALGASAAQQVSARFDALRATVVEIGVAGAAVEPLDAAGVPAPLIDQFPLDARARLLALDNIVAAGALLFRTADAEVALAPAVLATTQPGIAPGEKVVLSDAGLADAARLDIDGRWISENDQLRGRKVVVLGGLLAERLGLTSPRGNLVVDGRQYAVVGIVTVSPLRPELLDSLTIGRTQDDARQGWDVTDGSVVVARTLPGATQAIAGQAPLQLYPEQPGAFTASAPPDPDQFRETLEGDTQDIMRAFAEAGITLGVLATFLVWWSAVSARRGTIGLFRGAGATRAHIFRLIITECFLGGLIAGLIGTCLGVVVVSAICISRDWQLVMDPLLPLVTIVATTVLGGFAGSIPAWAAARVDPVESLRTG